MDLKSGDIFARRLRIIRKLGEGGMADVYLVEHTSLGRQYALKVLKWNMSQNKGLRQRLQVEAIAMGRAQHRNIVVVHDLDEHDGQLYIAMDYVSAGSLRDRQRREGPIQSREATRIVMEVLRGLQCAHEKGIVHRDVKPDNILLDAEGTPKICDFGIARASGEDRGFTKTGTIIGTFWFMAPEQHKITVRPDQRADIYAVGVMLHALIAGIVEPTALFFYATLFEDPDIMDPVPSVLRPVILKATAHRPDQRYGSAAEMITAIENVWSDLPTVSQEIEARRVPLMTMVPLGDEPLPSGTTFGFRSAVEGSHGSPEGVSVETGRRPVVAVVAVPEPSHSLPPSGGTIAREPENDDAKTDPKHHMGQPRRRMMAIVSTVAVLTLSSLVCGFWKREPSPVQALWQPSPEAVTSPKGPEPVGGLSAPPVLEQTPAVVPVIADPPTTPPAKVGKGTKEVRASKIEPRIKATPPPPVVVEAPKTRVTLAGDATQVRLIGDTGSFTLPTSVPPGTYRVVATFEGEPEPVTAIKRLQVDDKPVAISCDSSFARCNRE